MDRKPIQKTLTLNPQAANERTWEALLPATSGTICRECRKEADSIILEATEVSGRWFYGAIALCKDDLDYRLESLHRLKECADEVGGINDRSDKCWDRKTKDEGGFAHRGQADPE